MKIKSLTLCAALAACTPSEEVAWQDLAPTTPDLSVLHQQRIVGGAPFTGSPETALIVAFDANSEVAGLCSSTLVAANVLMTAAHCLDNPAIVNVAAYFGTDATVETDPGFELTAAAASFAIHPEWNPDDPGAGNDIAVIELAQAVPLAPKRVRTSPLTAADKGLPVELVGWGITLGGNTDFGIKRRVVAPLDDFDAKLVALGSATANTCQGDSGGPAFLGDRVIGETSFGDAGSVETGIYTRVDAFLGFLADAGVDVTPDAQDPTDPIEPPDDECGKLFGCEQNPTDPDDRDGGGCSTGRGNGLAALLVIGALLSARRTRRRAGR